MTNGTGIAAAAGITFGPTSSGKHYLSAFSHRNGNPLKSQWEPGLAPPEEYGIFVRADDSSSCDGEGNYWGVRDEAGGTLGTRGERLAKFPKNDMHTNPWHGYPIATDDGIKAHCPPDVLVRAWIDAGVVTRPFGRKIQRRRV